MTGIAQRTRAWLAANDPDLKTYAHESSRDVARRIIAEGDIEQDELASSARIIRKMRNGEAPLPRPAEEGDSEREGIEEVEADAPDTGDSVSIDWDEKRYVFAFVERAGVTSWDADFKEVSQWAWWYTSQGENRTARECCTLAYDEHARTITEAWFRRAMRILGLLKSSVPLAPHELEKFPRAEQQEKIVFQRRQARAQIAISSSEKRQWRRIAQDAQRQLDDRDRALERIAELVNSAPVRPFAYDYPEQHHDYLAVAGAFDVHIGKRVGNEGLDVTIENFLTAGEKLAARIRGYATPEKIICAFGGDYFHVDTQAGTTTSGTLQDVDASTGKILHSGIHAAIEYIEMMREVAPVEVVIVPGNHDSVLTWALASALEIRYAGVDGVTCPFVEDTRRYVQWGDALLCFEHGDGPKQKDLGAIIGKESRERRIFWQHAYAFVGHVHHDHMYDVGGITVLQCPSLAHADFWHHKKGFVLSRPAHAAYMFDRREGLIGTLRAHL